MGKKNPNPKMGGMGGKGAKGKGPRGKPMKRGAKGGKGGRGGKGGKRTKMKFDVNARLVVRNLSFKTSEENLKAHFEPYGSVLQVTLPKRQNGDIVGCGFVQYEFIDHAKLALNSRNNQPFLGRSIQVDWALPKDQFVKNQNENLEQIESQPQPSQSDEQQDKKNDNVTHNTSFQQRKHFERTSDPEEPKQERIKRKARLIIRNIAFKATEDLLKSHFAPYGQVLESVLLKKPNGELVGCGFIQFDNVQSATKAILKTNSKPFMGRSIFVDWAVAKNKYMAHVTQQKDEEEYLENDVKSEPESDTDDPITTAGDVNVSVKQESDEDNSDNEKDDESGSADESEDGSDVQNDENSNNEDIVDDKRVSANDAEDGRTVFLRNLSFNAIKDDLEEFAKQFGEIIYALVCVDKLTEHSKGTGFIRFKNKEDADMCYKAGPDQLTILGQLVEPLPALFRDKSKGGKSADKKQPKDSRNLYLIKEGVVLANSKSAQGVSASDMAKRLSLEQRKTEMLKNLNRFISRYRLTVHNVPAHYNDDDLKKVCLEMANAKPYGLKECRIMRNVKGSMGLDGKYESKGYAFVTFSKHETALTCLRRMNNNPNTFDRNNRPIVSFSIEDRSALNARKKRLEKSKVRNPFHKRFEGKSLPNDNKWTPKLNKNNDSDSKNEHNLNKKSMTIKKGKKSRDFKGKTNSVESKSHDIDYSEQPYAGEAGKPGKPVMMRSRYKLKMQANIHKENVKQEKRKQKSSKLTQNIVAKEKMKQPKQKLNTSKAKKIKNMVEKRDERNFSDIVNKYKSKLVGGSSEIKLKSKWYDKS